VCFIWSSLQNALKYLGWQGPRIKWTEKKQMYNSIQACRAVAALLVVLFHIGGVFAKEKYFGGFANPLQTVVSFGGPAGVAFIGMILTGRIN